MLKLADEFERMIDDAARLVPRFRYVRPERVLVLADRMGAYKRGEIAGLRHANEGRVRTPVFPKMQFKGREVVYVARFHPMLFTESSGDIVDTVCHELWHINESCEGRLRPMRHGKRFNAIVKKLATEYREHGGYVPESLSLDSRVRIRKWRTKETPSVCHVPRVFPVLPRDWKECWSEQDVVERPKILKQLLPLVNLYVCPNGHQVETHRKYKKVRSCAICSPKFNKRYVLSLVGSSVTKLSSK